MKAFLIALTFLLAACSSKNNQDPHKDLRKQEGWVENLPVKAGTSLIQKSARQRIILNKVHSSKKINNDKFWVAAQGYASVNNGITPYFWKSPRPPRLEITLTDDKKDFIKDCVEILKKPIPAGHVYALSGEGDFSPKMLEGKYLGVFNLLAVGACALVPEDCDENSKGRPECVMLGNQ